MAPVDFKNDPRISVDQREVLRDFCSDLGSEIVELANSLGLKVFSEDLLPYDSGYLEYAPTCNSPSNFRIIVNARHSLVRQRFTVAHEIAHFLLHREKENFEFRSETRHRSDDPFHYLEVSEKSFEHEANWFAAALLMPPNLFSPAFGRLDGDVVQLSKLFIVSEAAVCKRIKELGLKR